VIASVVGTGDKFFAVVVDTGEQTVREQRIRLKGPKSYTKITFLVFGKRFTCVSLCSDDINENHFYVIRYKENIININEYLPVFINCFDSFYF
jgi:hypothetical protein